MQTCFYHLSPYIFSIAGAIFKRRMCDWKNLKQPLRVMRVPLVTILARDMRLKFFEVDQALEMLRVALVTILGREMRLKFLKSTKLWRCCECLQSRCGREKCDWKNFEVDQALEMLRVPLVTILAREMRLTFFEDDQALEMLRVPLVTIIGTRNAIKSFWSRPSFGDVASAASHDIGLEMRLKFSQVDQRLEMLRVALVTILARKMRLKIFWSRPSFGDVPSAASHDIGARNAIETFWSRPSFGDVASAASHDICARNAIESFSSRPSFGDVASAASHDIGTRNAIEISKSTNSWKCC